MDTIEAKALLEYIRLGMINAKNLSECIATVDRAIELCESHNIEKLRSELYELSNLAIYVKLI